MKQNTDNNSEPVTKSDEVKGRVQRLVSFVLSWALSWAMRDHNKFVNKYLKKGGVKERRIEKLYIALDKWKRN